MIKLAQARLTLYTMHYHGTYIRCLPRNRCASKEQFLLFDLCKVFAEIESSHNSFFTSPKIPIFLHACKDVLSLACNISTMD